jgi:hypothetical protein
MTGAQRFGLWFAAAYLVFWMGGNYSFHYTHTCVRSHTEEQPVGTDGDTQMVTVCDWYSANAKRWTFLDPVRSVFTTWIGSWIDAAVVGGIAACIGVAVWRGRKRDREYEQYLAQLHEP